MDIIKEKTKVVKLGASGDSSITWQGKFDFKWSDTFEILAIHYNMKKLIYLNILIKHITVNGEIQNLIRKSLICYYLFQAQTFNVS